MSFERKLMAWKKKQNKHLPASRETEIFLNQTMFGFNPIRLYMHFVALQDKILPCLFKQAAFL